MNNAAEYVEERGGAKENAVSKEGAGRRAGRPVSNAQTRIRDAVTRNQGKLTALPHYISIEAHCKPLPEVGQYYPGCRTVQVGWLRSEMGQKASFWPCADHFRSSPNSGHSQRPSACLKGPIIGRIANRTQRYANACVIVAIAVLFDRLAYRAWVGNEVSSFN